MGMFEHRLRFRRRPLRRRSAEPEPPSRTPPPPPPPVKVEPPQTTFNDIVKSSQDAKNYRGLVLENGLKVLLVSDPTTTKSAACMCIESGHMSDPVDVPGIAHLVEHVLFLGSEKYPNENDFRSFVSTNGGFTNAQTFADVTKFFFDIVPEKLSEALDIFAQMFIAPLFKSASIVREISAVNNEHEKNLASDAWRIRMVNKSIANPNHPFSKFSTGNMNTLMDTPRRLGINIKDELVGFHEKWYRSGNLMNLSVVGKNTLDELEEMVKNCFISGIDNRNVEISKWTDEVYTADQLMTRTYIEPTMDSRTMTLSFPTPDLLEFYKSRPEEYIVNLVGHEGPGSILAELKRQGWSNSLNCDHILYANGFGFFEIKVDLTDEGYVHVDGIVKLIFQYLAMIKGLGIKEWIFEEHRNLRELDFRFEDEMSPLQMVKKNVSAMRHYPLSEVLSAPIIVSEWRPDLIQLILNMLNPRNMRVVIVDQTSYWKCNETEKIYNTKYGTELIPQSVIRDWLVCGMNKNLHLPQPNVFIPTDFEFLPIDDWKQTYPKIIRDSSLARVWFKQDSEFRKPKSIMTIELKTPTIHCDPLNWNLTHMFVWLLQDHLKEQLYVAELAGLECKIAITTSGIRIYIDGYSHKQDIFLETVLVETFRFKIDKRRFEDTYDSYLSDLKSFKADKPQHVAIYYLGVILTEQMWTNEELISTMKFVTIGRLKTFMKEVLSQSHAECFIFGNVNEEKALELSGLIEDRLNKARSYNMSKSAIDFLLATITMREMKLTEGVSHVYETVNSHHKINCTSLYIQCGVQDDKANVLLDLVLQILKEPFFHKLRTQEQQGYVVDSLIRRANGAQGMKFVVESTKHPDYIENRIATFLETMTDEISSMPATKFESIKHTLKIQKLPKFLTLADQFWQYFKEISNQQYHFNRNSVEISVLRSITQDEVVTFYKTFIAPQSTSRRSISIHVVSKGKKVDGRGNSENLSSSFAGNYTRVEDLMEFKSSLQVFPKTRTKSLRQFYNKTCKK